MAGHLLHLALPELSPTKRSPRWVGRQNVKLKATFVPMAKSELITRPLTATERRWLRFVGARRERFLLRAGPYLMLLLGIVFFGGLWGLSVLATRADKAGPSWRVFGVFWLVVGTAITLWAYRDVKPHAHVLQEKLRSALRQNAACEIRIRISSSMVIECENKQDHKKGWYGFQFDDEHIVFVSARFCQRVRGFPTSDFSMVDIADEKGKIIAGYARNHGDPLVPLRTISKQEAGRLRIPEHMEIVSGNLTQIDTLLGVYI